MRKIFKNLIPYWYMVILIFCMLGLQAYCDLSLPSYTSDLIDVGIQNHGISHILPKKMTNQEMSLSEVVMTEDEKELLETSYTKKEDIYELKNLSEQELDQLDDKLLMPIVMAYQMGNMKEDSFKDLVIKSLEANPNIPVTEEQIRSMTVEQISQLLQVQLKTFEAEDENGKVSTYVDVRPLMLTILADGSVSIEQMRTQMETMIDTIGSNTLKSMGISYAIQCDKEANVDVDAIQIQYLWNQGKRMLSMAGLMLIASVAAGFLSARTGAGIGRKLRGSIFERVVRFSNTEMDQFSTASLITRSTNDVQQIQMVTTMMLRMALYAPILGIGGILKVMETKAHMGWIIVMTVLMISGLVLLLVSVAMPKFKLMQKLIDQLNLVSREILTGLSVIRAFGREKEQALRFETANENLMKTQLFTNRVMTFMMPCMMIIMNCTTLLIVWVSAHRIDAGTLQVGAMTAFITYSMQIVMSFLMLTAMSIMLPRAGVAADRIDEVLQTVPSIADPNEPEPYTEGQGVLSFRHVHFRYPNAKKEVLSDIDFTVQPGQTTAIIGSTGCGKSTVVNLIPRFYDVTEGSIELDGHDIRNIRLKDLRDQIAFVPQKGVLFSGTVSSNLRFGNREATTEDMRKAAKTAQAIDFIESDPGQFEKAIAQGGSNVSGGQKQRLAIARALVKPSRILVFDDSFSALDMKTDANLRKALESQVKDKAVIIVAQRISTILHADQIIVLRRGKVVGKGTHAELLKTCQVYQEIATSQLSEEELEKSVKEVVWA